MPPKSKPMSLKLMNKVKLLLLLNVMLVLLVVSNMITQRNFQHIEKAAKSIYEDRLLPSMYIFEIREYLYKAKLEQDKSRPMDATSQKAIANLVDKYEHTLLTKQEYVDLSSLKSNLNLVSTLPPASPDYDRHLRNTLEDLNHLLHIQSGEGSHLKEDMINNIRWSTVLSYIDICLLVLIGALTVYILASSRAMFFRQLPHDPSLN